MSGPVLPSRPTALVRLIRARLIRQADRSFLQPVLTLMTGTAAAQLLVLAARPVLTRLFDAEAFGVLTVFVALSAVLTAVSAGRFEDALMLPRRRSAAVNVLALALGATLVSSMLALLVLPVADTVAGWLGGNEMVHAIRWLPAAVLCLGGTLVLESWHTRSHRYRLLSVSRTVQSAVIVSVQIGAGLLAIGAVGLVLGTAAGFAAAALILGLAAGVLDGRLSRALSVRWMRRLAGRYARFPRYSAPASMLNTLGQRAPALLLAVLFASEVVGYFGVAFGTLALPVGLATGAIGQVFFVRSAEAVRSGRLTELTVHVFRHLVIVATFPMLAVMVAGPTLFGFVFGPGWETAGEYARWLAPWILFASIAPPLTRLFDVLERQRADFAFSIVLFLAVTAALVTAGLLSDPLTTLIFVSMVGAVSRVAHIGFMLRLASVRLGSAARILGWGLAASAPPLALVVAAERFLDSGLATLAATALAAAIYLGLTRLLPGSATVST